MQSDEQCYLRFLSGDRGALEELIAIHRNGLTLFLTGIVHDYCTAEDLMIDTFAQLIVSKSRYRHKASLKTYLFTIGRNLALKSIKDNKNIPEVPFVEADPSVAGEIDTVLNNDRNRYLYAAIQKLSPEYEQVLMLIYFEEMSYDEAAEVMHKNRKQISNLAYRAKKSLKEILEKEGFVYEI